MHILLSAPFICLFYTIVGYLSGNVLYAYWLPKGLYGVDIREGHADHNPGAANAAITCGLPIGILCAALDVLKGTLPVLLSIKVGGLSGWYLVPVVLAPVCGHAWPVFWHGHGGKAISVSFGVFIGLLPQYLLAPLWAVLLLIGLLFLRDHRQLILLTSVLLATITFWVYPMPYVRAMACGVAVILVIKHRRPRVLSGAPDLPADDEPPFASL